jgi:hypothetical protein
MRVIPIPRQPQHAPDAENQPSPTLRFVAGGTLLAGAVLLLAGKRKAGLAVTAAGTALTLLHEKETTVRWWAALPLVLNNAQRLIGKAQTAMDEFDTHRQKLRSIVRR